MAGSNPDGGDIFSERYLARKGCGAKGGTRMMDNEMHQNWKGWKYLFYDVFELPLKPSKFTAKSSKYYIFWVAIYATIVSKSCEYQL